MSAPIFMTPQEADNSASGSERVTIVSSSMYETKGLFLSNSIANVGSEHATAGIVLYSWFTFQPLARIKSSLRKSLKPTITRVSSTGLATVTVGAMRLTAIKLKIISRIICFFILHRLLLIVSLFNSFCIA